MKISRTKILKSEDSKYLQKSPVLISVTYDMVRLFHAFHHPVGNFLRVHGDHDPTVARSVNSAVAFTQFSKRLKSRPYLLFGHTVAEQKDGFKC